MSASDVLALDVIKIPKSYESLADQLRERILDGTIPAGALLPNERELGEQTGLSRGSVREALLTLEAQGLVVTRVGRNGGRIAQRPGLDDISQSLELFVRGQQIELRALLETAETLEPGLAALAALHRTDEDIRRLERATKSLRKAGENAAHFLEANTEWHLAVASSSHNPVLVAMMHSVGSLLHNPHVENFTSQSVRSAVIKAHARVQEAIVAGNADAARRRMERHVKAYGDQVVGVAPSLITLP